MDTVEPPDVYLGVAVDSRIREVLNDSFRGPPPTSGKSTHLKIQEIFGKAITIDPVKIDLATFLAQPATKGGLTFLLLQPGFTHKYETGPAAVIDDCKSLFALKDAIKFCTTGALSIEDFTVLDSLPLLDSRALTGSCKPLARAFFREMVYEKAPDVVLCMWQDKTDVSGVEDLVSQGVGKKFAVEQCKIGNKTCNRVNAFHPSYMMNYHPYDSCFRQLFILEVAHAFGVLHGTWKNELWMDRLREHCTSMARKRSSQRTLRRLNDRVVRDAESKLYELKNASRMLGTIHNEDRDKSEIRDVVDLCNDISLILVDLSSKAELAPALNLTPAEYATKSLLAQLKHEHFHEWVPNRTPGSKGFYRCLINNRLSSTGRLIDEFFESLNNAFTVRTVSGTRVTTNFDFTTLVKAFKAFPVKLEQSLARAKRPVPRPEQSSVTENSNIVSTLASKIAQISINAPAALKTPSVITTSDIQT